MEMSENLEVAAKRGSHLLQAAKAVAARNIGSERKLDAGPVAVRENAIWARLSDGDRVFFDVCMTANVEHLRLAQEFVSYILRPGSTLKQRNSIEKVCEYFGFFSDFIAEGASEKSDAVSVAGLKASVLLDYEYYLGQYKYEGKSGQVQSLSPQSCALRYNSIRAFLRWCKGQQHLGLASQMDLTRKVGAGRHKQSQQRETIPLLELAKIRAQCLLEVKQIVDRLEFGESMMKCSDIAIPSRSAKAAEYKDIFTAVKIIKTEYGGIIPPTCKLMEDRPGLERAMRGNYYSSTEVLQYLCFSGEMLVPFVILIGMDTCFNPTTLLSMRWAEDIDREAMLFGEKRWVLKGDKNRAAGPQERSYAAGLKDLSNPVSLLQLLEKYNSALYRHAPDGVGRYVFAFFNKHFAPSLMFDAKRRNTSNNWDMRAKEFFKRCGVENYPLSSLRASGAEIIFQLSGGDLTAVRDALNHRSISTTYNHYRSEESRLLAQTRLAEAIEWRLRYVESGGRSDTRIPDRYAGPRSAATPGFNCLEPEYSPILGQEEGKKCTAYGYCPACPLSWVDPGSASSLAQLRHVRAAIEDARSEIAPQRWLAEWAPQLLAIEQWSQKFSQDVAAVADRIPFQSLPTIE